MPNYKQSHKTEGELFTIIVRWMKENGIKAYEGTDEHVCTDECGDGCIYETREMGE